MSKCLNLFYMVRHGKVSTMIVTENRLDIFYVADWRRENVQKSISDIP